MKKIILFVIDALTARVFIPALKGGELPNFQLLAQAGQVVPECISVFPSLTPAATASIITGQYPNQHNILGFHWYDLQNDEVIYYGDDFWVIWREGFGQFFEDFVYKMNHNRLQGDTLFQRAEAANLSTASLNYLIYRGNTRHKINLSHWLNLWPGLHLPETVNGSTITYFGDLIDTEILPNGASAEKNGGIFHRFGFDDDNSFKLLLQLAQTNNLPDFTLAYFPDNDFESHQVGPEAALPVLQALDKKLGQFFDQFGGVEPLLEEYCLLITGDHAQTEVLDDPDEAGINLDDILSDFELSPPGTPWHNNNQLLICPDMRSAQIYWRNIDPNQVEYMVALLTTDPRVDQVIWRAKHSGDDEPGYYVATLERGRLTFWRGDDGPNTARDRFGNTWSWQGDLRAVSGAVNDAGALTFAEYPNAFERIEGGLNSKNSGQLWATARLGFEFRLNDTSIHTGGGSHGSLHRRDSTSLLLVAGAPDSLQPVATPCRTVDIVPLCASILNLEIEPRRNPGSAAVAT